MGNPLHFVPTYMEVLRHAAVALHSNGVELRGVELPTLDEGGHLKVRNVSLSGLRRNRRSKLFLPVPRYGDLVLNEAGVGNASHLFGICNDLALFEMDDFRFLLNSRHDLLIISESRGVAIIFNLKTKAPRFWYNTLHKGVDPTEIESFDQLVPYLS